jgi:DNA-binding transcriptional LysR family regulator
MQHSTGVAEAAAKWQVDWFVMRRRVESVPALDIRQLQYFLKIVDLGSFTAAASHLGIAQPTLTKSMRSLERQLGVELLRRLPRGIEPTEAGQRLAEHGRRAELQLRDAVSAIGNLNSNPAGVVTIGAGPAWLRRILPDAVCSAISRYPELNVHIVGGFDDSLLKDLRAGLLDIVVAELPEVKSATDLSLTRLVQDDLGIAARAGHPLARKSSHLGDLLEFPWIMPPVSTRARRRLEALFVAANLPAPDVRIETASMAFLLQAVRGGDFLTFTVRTTLDAADGSGLAWLDVPALVSSREAGILVRRDSWVSPAMRALMDELVLLCARDPRN